MMIQCVVHLFASDCSRKTFDNKISVEEAQAAAKANGNKDDLYVIQDLAGKILEIGTIGDGSVLLNSIRPKDLNRSI